MGFNPFREHEKTALDFVIVALAVLVTIGAIAWAILST